MASLGWIKKKSQFSIYYQKTQNGNTIKYGFKYSSFSQDDDEKDEYPSFWCIINDKTWRSLGFNWESYYLDKNKILNELNFDHEKFRNEINHKF